jgi:outer membrane protein assembly factor BamE
MLQHLRNRVLSTLVTFTALVLAGCGTLDGVGDKAAQAVTPYKIDIVQGNVVTREQLAVLKPGMPRALVQDVLGTSLLASVFHSDRWDYVFTLKRQGAEPQARKVTVFFKEDVLERVEADELPSESEFVASLKSTPNKGPLPALSASDEKLKQFPTSPKTEVAAPNGTASTVYPPLEPSSP